MMGPLATGMGGGVQLRAALHLATTAMNLSLVAAESLQAGRPYLSGWVARIPGMNEGTAPCHSRRYAGQGPDAFL